MSASTRWGVLCLAGIVLWIAAGVIPGAVADDPTDPTRTLLGFAAGGTVFFGAVFGYTLWRMRAKPDLALDGLLRELALPDSDEWDAKFSVSAITASRQMARAYVIGGIVVTALGLSVIWQEGLEIGNTRITLYVLGAVVVIWAAATPAIIGRAQRNSEAVLAPLGLTQNGAVLSGERHGRKVSVSLDGQGSTTRVEGTGSALPLEGEAIVAYSTRGTAETWLDVEATQDGERIKVRRKGHDRAHWLWDLWLAERLAS